MHVICPFYENFHWSVIDQTNICLEKAAVDMVLFCKCGYTKDFNLHIRLINCHIDPRCMIIKKCGMTTWAVTDVSGREAYVWHIFPGRFLRAQVWGSGWRGVHLQGARHHKTGRDLSQTGGIWMCGWV